MHEEKLKHNMRKMMCLILLLFIVLILYITYLQVMQSDELANHALNMRARALENTVQRGDIYDQTHKKIAYSEKNAAGGFTRVYPYNALFSQPIGYYGNQLGKTGIEGFCDAELSGGTQIANKLGVIGHLMPATRGNGIKLTLDYAIQLSAYQALGDHKGAVVVLDANTGAVLAMVSKPNFDPNALERDWTEIKDDQSAPLLNRASQGLYPPGSILKVMIADAALNEKVISTSDTYDCPGYLKLGDQYTLYEDDHAIHGKVDLEKGLAVSCNVMFGSLALELGPERLAKAFKRFGFFERLDNEIPESEIHLPDLDELGRGDLCQIGIGQSSLLVTPLRMAMIASAFANDGGMMKPYLIDEIISPSGGIIEKHTAENWLRVTDPETARMMLNAMRNVVAEGTATRAYVQEAKVAGKTGSAENSSGDSHAWFIGSASVSARNLAFAIIVENGGSGGRTAAPIAKKIIADILAKEGGAQ